MKPFLLNKNSIALGLTCVLTIAFFIAGLLDILNYFIVKVLLFLGFGGLFATVVIYAIKNDIKKNRPEDQLQDDSH